MDQSKQGRGNHQATIDKQHRRPPKPYPDGKLVTFLKHYGLYQHHIAEALGLSRGTFGDKARGLNNQRFNRGERERIVAIINSIPRVTEADLFDEEDNLFKRG